MSKQLLEEYWKITYRTVTSTPSEMSDEYGPQWDYIDIGPWVLYDRKYPDKASAFKKAQELKDKGFEIRVKDHQIWHYIENEIGI